MDPINNLDELVRKYAALRDLHLEIYRIITDVQDGIKSGKYTMKDMVNAMYVLRETGKFGDDIRAECERLTHLLEKACCALFVTASTAGDIDGGPIRTGLTTGTPKIRMAAALPSQRDNPEAYDALMNFYGIPKHTVELDVIRLYWPKFVDHMTRLAEEGKPTPPGIDVNRTYPVYSVGLRSRHHIDEVVRMLSERRTEKQRIELLKELNERTIEDKTEEL